MEHTPNILSARNSNRFGLHYFADVERYADDDAHLWAARLSEVGAKWIALKNPENRAIPEIFIRTLADCGINIIVDFGLSPDRAGAIEDILPLIEAYGRWGVKYAIFSSNVNQESKWTRKTWINKDIVSLFAQAFIKFSSICVQNNIHPVFSPLVHGGDYNDLAFLNKALEIIKPHTDIIDQMVIAVYAHHHDRALNWGAGGKKQWKRSRIFDSTGEGQDHLGFRAFEWYGEAAEKVIGRKLPLILLEAGRVSASPARTSPEASHYQEMVLTIHNLLSGLNVYMDKEKKSLYAPLDSTIIGCLFYLVSAETDESLYPYRWFKPNGERLSIAEQLCSDSPQQVSKKLKARQDNTSRPLNPNRYIYFDNSVKASMPFVLKRLDSYIRKFRPKMGYSLIEAADSAHILIVTSDKDQFMLNNESLVPADSIYKIIQMNEFDSDVKGYPHAE